MNQKLAAVMVALVFSFSLNAMADWRTEASAAAQEFAARIEALDEILHVVAEEKETPAFHEAVEKIHHVEDVVISLANEILTAPYQELCPHFSHLYHDLVEMRQYLIHLGLESNPQVVQRWNHMVAHYNNRLRHYFHYCHHNGVNNEASELYL